MPGHELVQDSGQLVLARRLSLVSAGLGQPVRELSGGNQQKVTVARGWSAARS